MKSTFRITSIFLILLLFLSSAVAQTTTTDTKPKEVKEVEYSIIPVIEIPQKIDEIYTFLKEINIIEIPATDVTKLEESFTTFIEEISHLKKESTKEILEKTTTKKLEDYKIKWNSFLTNLTEFKKMLQEASERLDKERNQIKDVREYGKLTVANAKEEKAPKQLLNRLRELKLEIDKTDKALFKILSKVLAVRDRVSVEEVSVKETLAIINTQIDENRSLIFTINSTPLWNAFSDSTDSLVSSENFNNSIERVDSAFIEFWDMYSEEFPYYIGFFFIIFLIILYLKSFANKHVSAEIIEKEKYAIKILNRPFFVALLIAFYSELLFFPLAPSAVTEISKILLILPLLVLFPTFISKASRGPLFFISSIYLLHQITELSVGSGLFLRIFNIVLTSLMIIALIWFLKIDNSKIGPERVKLLNLLHVVSKFLVFILGIALLSNVIGNTALSTLVFNGVMRTIYTSLVLITALQVFYTLLTIIIETKFAKISLIVQNKSNELKKSLYKLAKIGAVIFWISKLLMNFELYDSVYKTIIKFFTTPLSAGSFSIDLLEVVSFFLAIWISIKFSKLIRFFFEDEIFKRVKLPRGVPAAVSLMMKYTIITLGFFVALSIVGFSMEKFAIIAGALGVGIGFGLQSIVNNFISGLILLFERPIQVGDTISLPTLMGSVKRIGIRASIIQTFEGAEVIVPNADLITGQVTNWTLSDSKRRVEIKIGVHFSANPDEVMNILNKSLDVSDEILKNPAPYILYKGHIGSTQNFDLRFWTLNSGDWIFIRSDILLKITEMLNDAGIEIPYQQQNLYIKEMGKKNNSK